MRLFTSIFLILILAPASFGQTIDKLDEKNGFKEFKLGDNYSKWEVQLKYDGQWKDGTKGYLYIGSCCQKVFNYNVDRIILRFSDNKLVGILITTEKFQKENTTWRPDDFEKINASFSRLFGEPTSVETPQNSGEVTFIWAGEKVILFSKYEYLGVKEGDRQLITVADLNFLNKEIEEGF